MFCVGFVNVLLDCCLILFLFVSGVAVCLLALAVLVRRRALLWFGTLLAFGVRCCLLLGVVVCCCSVVFVVDGCCRVVVR